MLLVYISYNLWETTRNLISFSFAISTVELEISISNHFGRDLRTKLMAPGLARVIITWYPFNVAFSVDWWSFKITDDAEGCAIFHLDFFFVKWTFANHLWVFVWIASALGLFSNQILGQRFRSKIVIKTSFQLSWVFGARHSTKCVTLKFPGAWFIMNELAISAPLLLFAIFAHLCTTGIILLFLWHHIIPIHLKLSHIHPRKFLCHFAHLQRIDVFLRLWHYLGNDAFDALHVLDFGVEAFVVDFLFFEEILSHII